MRLENSARNVGVAWMGQAISVLLAFVARSFFANYLTMEYMGLENLFSNVLTVLSLAELGVGSAIVFSLYEPLAKDDREQVKSLMRLFKRAYIAIGISVAVVGCALAPFITELIEDVPDIPYIHFYFLCFVANSSVSYFFSYKGLLITADQKKYLVSLCQYAFQTLMSIAQILVLIFTGEYFLFLGCMIASTLGQNIVISCLADRRYPYIKEKNIAPIQPDVLLTIKKNIGALLLHRIAGVASIPASSLIISKFVGISAIAIYGNYMLIINSLTRIADQAFDAIVASVGNLRVTASTERQYEVFQTVFFINAFLYACIASPLLCLFNPLVELWLGSSYLFPIPIVMLVVLLFYLKGMRSAALSFISAYGLFWQTRWKAVIETLVILALSLIFVLNFEIAGVIVAGIITCVSISMTVEGYMLYKHGLHQNVRQYFHKMLVYVALTIALVALSYGLCTLVVIDMPIISFIIKLLVSMAVPLLSFVVLFCRTREYKELIDIMKRLVHGVGARLHRS